MRLPLSLRNRSCLCLYVYAVCVDFGLRARARDARGWVRGLWIKLVKPMVKRSSFSQTIFGMYTAAADPRRPNTGGFRLSPARDAAGLANAEARRQAAAAARHAPPPRVGAVQGIAPSAPHTGRTKMPALWQIMPQPSPRPWSANAEAGVEASSGAGVDRAVTAARLRAAVASGREVGRLSGLVEQGEQVVNSLLKSMRALKEKNRLLAEKEEKAGSLADDAPEQRRVGTTPTASASRVCSPRVSVARVRRARHRVRRWCRLARRACAALDRAVHQRAVQPG